MQCCVQDAGRDAIPNMELLASTQSTLLQVRENIALKGIVMVRVRVQKLEIPQSLRLDVQIRDEAVAHTGCRTGHSRILS